MNYENFKELTQLRDTYIEALELEDIKTEIIKLNFRFNNLITKIETTERLL